SSVCRAGVDGKKEYEKKLRKSEEKRAPATVSFLRSCFLGTLVDISKAFLNMNEPGEVNNYWALNLTSMLFLIYSTPNAFPE
ncbi:hypothetical protein ACQP3F_33340, partial [Escherichia coli]